jgi:asparagine synthase (glutamine-hydrolysing)
MGALDAAFESAVRRHVPAGETHGVLLSGGRDSRLLSGYIVERGDTLKALTFGRSSDYEVIGARRVARELGFEHRVVGLDEARLVEDAEIQSRWEHLAMGFSNLHMWGAVEPLSDLPRRVVCGHGLETRAGEPLPPDFDAMMDLRKHRGVPRATIKRLLRRERFDGVQESVEAELRESYEGYSDDERYRGWRFYLDHDWRSHAGGVPWKLTFGAWPIVPICDRGVMDVIASMPESEIADRASHDAIMRRRFPRLARLPLDRNNHDMLPLSPSSSDRMKEKVMQPVRRVVSKGADRRYYHRVYDINGPGWRAVRKLAEPHRDRLSDLFDMDVVREIVPSPETVIKVENNVRDTFGTKLLLGLMLWSASCS